MAKNSSIIQAKYDKSHCRTYGLKLNLGTDADIIEKLASVPSMQGYIKELIREDIARTRTETNRTIIPIPVHNAVIETLSKEAKEQGVSIGEYIWLTALEDMPYLHNVIRTCTEPVPDSVPKNEEKDK